MKEKGKFVTRAIPWSPNRKMHWAVRAAWKKAWEEAVWVAWTECNDRWMATTKITHLPIVQISFYTRTPMDDDNAQAACKPLYDGLVKAGILIDDSPKWVTILPPRVHQVSINEAHVEIEITK